MKNVLCLIIFLISLSFLLSSCKNESAAERPNFVIIQLDDLGYDDLSINGNKIVETPNIDSFANNSIRFDQFYVNPVCAPSRASLLTGRHFLKTGISHVHGGKDFLDLDERTVADILKRQGYQTGMWGKWHSGHSDGYYPWQRGFDEAYMAQLYQHRDNYGVLNGTPVAHKKWADQVITDYALDFIDRNKQQPFLAYLSYLSVHAPLDAPDSLRRKYQDKGLSYSLATLYGMVEHVDHYLGKFFYALDSMGLEENTLVFLLSDNGPAILNGQLSDEDRRIRYVNAMKGHKGDIWENGVRSPLFVRWKGVSPSYTSHELIDVSDIFPSIVLLAGCDLSSLEKPLDGIPFCSLIEGETEEDRNKTSYNYANRGWPPTQDPWSPEGVLDEYRPVPEGNKSQELYDAQIISVRKGAYKLLHKPDPKSASLSQEDAYVLIDIDSDPREEHNLYTQLPEEANALKALLQNWWEAVLSEPGAFNMPVFRVGYDGEVYSRILAKGPARVSDDVRSAYSYLSGWVEPGAFAEYKIDVAQAGTYKIALIYKGKPNGASLEISCGNARITNSIQTYDKAMFGSLDLPEGPSVLRLELIENASGSEVFEQLQAIELRAW